MYVLGFFRVCLLFLGLCVAAGTHLRIFATNDFLAYREERSDSHLITSFF